MFLWIVSKFNLCLVFCRSYTLPVSHKDTCATWEALFGFSSVQFSSVAQSCPTLGDPMDCSMPGLTVHRKLPEFTQAHVHWVGNAIQSSYPLLTLLLLPSIFPSIRVFQMSQFRWPKYWSFSFNISPCSEDSGPISLRLDWLDLLAVQGTLKSLLQHHSSKASILCHSAFFTVQLYIHAWLLEKP